MMGVAQATLDAAMTKTTSGLFLPRSQVVQFTAMPYQLRPLRCSLPHGLMPCELSELLETGNYDAAETGNVMDCIEWAHARLNVRRIALWCSICGLVKRKLPTVAAPACGQEVITC